MAVSAFVCTGCIKDTGNGKTENPSDNKQAIPTVTTAPTEKEEPVGFEGSGFDYITGIMDGRNEFRLFNDAEKRLIREEAVAQGSAADFLADGTVKVSSQQNPEIFFMLEPDSTVSGCDEDGKMYIIPPAGQLPKSELLDGLPLPEFTIAESAFMNDSVIINFSDADYASAYAYGQQLKTSGFTELREAERALEEFGIYSLKATDTRGIMAEFMFVDDENGKKCMLTVSDSPANE